MYKRQLGFTAKRTMNAAQKLYEGIPLGELGQISLVTYIRTDSVRVSSGEMCIRDSGYSILASVAYT